MPPRTVAVDELRAKLSVLRARAARGGADPLELRPAIDPGQLEDAERALGVRLPEDYRAFLTEIGNGGAGPPTYGLYAIDRLTVQSSRGIYATADPFEPPGTADDLVDLDAGGMLLIGHNGCGYWDGLVVAGPERGSVWTFVEVRPGWVPICDASGTVVGPGGRPFVHDGEDYDAWYGALLLPINRDLRVSFSRYYEQWLDEMLASPPEASS